MNPLKDTRWKQRFVNFERIYKLLEQNVHKPLETEIEKAGLIQFFEIAFELSWKLMKDYLEAQEIIVKSPREAIKQAYQIELIQEGHLWIDALSDRNATVHTYDENMAQKMVNDIISLYFPILKDFYLKLQKEIS